jgi:hypothetical protein
MASSLTATATTGLTFPPTESPSICGFSIGLLKLPSFSLALILDFLGLPKIPFPFLGLRLTCDLSKPVDITAGLDLPFGGGRIQNNDPSPYENDFYP